MSTALLRRRRPCCANAGCAARRSGARSCARSEPARRSTFPPTRSTRAPRGSFPISGAAPSTRRSPSSPNPACWPRSARPDPVRYETNTDAPRPLPLPSVPSALRPRHAQGTASRSVPRGFTLERVETRAEGTCAECARLPARPAQGSAHRSPQTAPCRNPLPPGLACRGDAGPLGTLLLAASPAGLSAWPSRTTAMRTSCGPARRADAAASAARAHPERAAHELQSYLLADTIDIRCPLDWDALAARDREGLAATRAIPYGDHRSYAALGSERSRLRGRPDHGRQPGPDRRALPPRDPRDRAPAGVRRRARAPALARCARAPPRHLRHRPRTAPQVLADRLGVRGLALGGLEDARRGPCGRARTRARAWRASSSPSPSVAADLVDRELVVARATARWPAARRRGSGRWSGSRCLRS